jgi:hypothetical protein
MREEPSHLPQLGVRPSIPLGRIDAVVAASLGPDRVSPQCTTQCNVSIHRHVSVQACWRLEHDARWEVLQRERSFKSKLCYSSH